MCNTDRGNNLENVELKELTKSDIVKTGSIMATSASVLKVGTDVQAEDLRRAARLEVDEPGVDGAPRRGRAPRWEVDGRRGVRQGGVRDVPADRLHEGDRRLQADVSRYALRHGQLLPVPVRRVWRRAQGAQVPRHLRRGAGLPPGTRVHKAPRGRRPLRLRRDRLPRLDKGECPQQRMSATS